MRFEKCENTVLNPPLLSTPIILVLLFFAAGARVHRALGPRDHQPCHDARSADGHARRGTHDALCRGRRRFARTRGRAGLLGHMQSAKL